MDVFAAVADPTRRKVLDLLRTGERAAGDLSRAFPHLSQPAMSQHLKVLRETGLVRVRPELQKRIYSLDPGGFAELDAWLGRYRAFWELNLGALERHLDHQHGRRASRPKRRNDG